MKAINEITNSEDILDSRDIIARLEYLEGLEPEEITEDEQGELSSLKSFAEEAEGYAPDWQYGAPLIRDSYFEDYARELADDMGLIQDDAQWPYTCIDWERAARELRMDYSGVEFGGVTYWVR